MEIGAGQCANMIRRSLYLTALLLVALSLAAFDTSSKPDPHTPQYNMGYEAGRRDERKDICNKFEKRSVIASTILGEARMILIRAFWAAHS
jgi:hypothetical protein